MGELSYDERMEQLQNEANELNDYMSDDNETEEAFERMDELSFCRDYSNCIIVDNLPIVGDNKYAKLSEIVKKIFSKIGTIVDFDMPLVENGKTDGFAFIEYETVEAAADAFSRLNNFALDKKHVFRVNRHEDFQKYLGVSDSYIAPERPEEKEKPDLRRWLSDDAGRDMFVLRYGLETEIFWSDHGTPALDYAGDREKQNGKQWCTQYVLWSPQGSYLLTFHPQGVAVWGGEKWEKLGRFAHKNVKIAVFSPRERYLVTCNDMGEDSTIIFWEVATGKMLRQFPTHGGPNAIEGVVTPFKWSHDDKYVARRGKDVISIYETPSMKLLGKKSLKADGVSNFFWSPTDNIISFWAPESANVPARVSLVEIPSRKQIRQKNLFNVSDCKLHWQTGGNFLCVKVTRHSKSKKTLYTNFELFRPREDLVPVEMLEMKETVVAFSWEPKGTRFAVVHGEQNQRLNVSFYDMCGGNKNNELTLLYTLKEKACNHLFWSPQGNYIVLAGLGEMNGILEFWDTDEKQSLAQQEHYKCTSVEWDASGRVVSTAVCQPLDSSYYKYQMDNGYNLWTFQGKNLLEQRKESFYQFLWRPRPKSLLTDSQYKEVVKNLKKYERKYQDLDRKKERERVLAEKNEKKRLINEFFTLLSTRQMKYLDQRNALIELRDGYDTDEENQYEIQTRTYDEILSQTEEIMKN